MKISLKISKQFFPLPVGIGLGVQSGFEDAYVLEKIQGFVHSLISPHFYTDFYSLFVFNTLEN